MDPKRTALVLIEYQNDFTSKGGTLHDAVKGVMEQNNMLQNTVETVKKAREAGCTIVYAPITFVEGYGELSSEPYGILKGVVDSKSFRKGSWGAEIVDVLKPQPGDIVVEGKRGLCGFASTNLDFILRSRGIETIALGGFLTNCCVESTMRTGVRKGLQGHHAERLHRGAQRRRAEARDREELPDVLAADESRRVPHRARRPEVRRRDGGTRLLGLATEHKALFAGVETDAREQVQRQQAIPFHHIIRIARDDRDRLVSHRHRSESQLGNHQRAHELSA